MGLRRLAAAAVVSLACSSLAGCASRDGAGAATTPAVATASAPATSGHGHPAAPAPPSARATLLPDLGAHRRPVSTGSAEAQRFFDQGLTLLFAFNLEEAQRSFAEAARLDPQCAMCWWGEGMSWGPHINLPGMPDRTLAGHAATAKALAALAGEAPATAVEQALVEALATRFADPAPSDVAGQRRLDEAYAAAMQQVARRFPDDLDVQALSVEARMNLRPWDLWTADGMPQPGTEAIVADLEAILARAPRHPAANHYYIHAVEASARPERAVAAADRLPALVPGAAHLVHMPAHIYMRVGRYADASAANRRAVEVDERYLADAGPLFFYAMYAAHNHQFLWASALMQGRYAESLAAARRALGPDTLAMLEQMPGFDFMLGYPIWTQVRFGRYEAALAEDPPPLGLPFASLGWHAARGIAAARLARLDDARAEAAHVARLLGEIPADARQGLNAASTLGELARASLAGEIAAAEGRLDDAARELAAAVAIEDGLAYNEPSDWYWPVRPTLGRVLLAAGRAAAAREVFAADLRANPENGWSLYGLALAEEQAGAPAAAQAARQRLGRAWSAADTELRPDLL